MANRGIIAEGCKTEDVSSQFCSSSELVHEVHRSIKQRSEATDRGRGQNARGSIRVILHTHRLIQID